MTPQERQIIESLFQRLQQAAAQAGPRDPEAEALIQQRLQSFPGGPYSMAQTLIVQEQALREAEARLGQAGGRGSFLPGGGQPYQPPLMYQQQPRGRGVGDFLAGAGQMALGIGGGILVADAVMGLAHGLFDQPGGGWGDDRGPFDGYAASPDQAADQQDQGYDQSGDLGDPGDAGDLGDLGSQDW